MQSHLCYLYQEVLPCDVVLSCALVVYLDSNNTLRWLAALMDGECSELGGKHLRHLTPWVGAATYCSLYVQAA